MSKVQHADMVKLTKEQKLLVYKRMLELLEVRYKERKVFSFCSVAPVAVREVLGRQVFASHIFPELPELLSYKPDRLYDIVNWWSKDFSSPDRTKRITILKEIIWNLEN